MSRCVSSDKKLLQLNPEVELIVSSVNHMTYLFVTCFFDVYDVITVVFEVFFI